jgi:4-amino-4-deoxy-L-arabinose transferase-like glycosyltransferase
MTPERATKGNRWGGAWEVLLLGAIVTLGLWLRWLYARDVSFFVDEYLTARAAHKILEGGVPLLPSGNFYSHGLLLSYIEAAITGLGGGEAWIMRLPVLILSAAAIVLTWWFGRRAFSPATGLIGSVLLAVAPEAILWGGRVRMYAPLQFFVLLATVAFYFWVVRERDRFVERLVFVLAYWGALFSHAEAMLLLPIWGLWALVQRGWRWCLQLPNLVAFGLSGLAIVIEILLRRLGPPVQARLVAGTFEPLVREYLGAGIDWPGIQKVVEPLFLTPLRLPLSLLVVGGGLYLLLSWAARAWQRARAGSNPELGTPKDRPPGRQAQRQALAYLYALVVPTLVLLLFVVDPSWKSPRYGLMLLPHFFLIASAFLCWLGGWLWGILGGKGAFRRQTTWTWIAVTAIVLLITVASWPSARAATRESVPSYDWAFAYVQEHLEPGDKVITFLCPAAFFHLGRCDYLAIPVDFSGFAVQRRGRWVSGWDEVPILDGAQQLDTALAADSRAWFVVDEGRFLGRYDDEFVETVLERMTLVAAEREVLVFRSKKQSPIEATLGQTIRLAGYDLQPGTSLIVPDDETLELTLFWEALAPVQEDYTVFVHLVDSDGRIRAQGDGVPLEGSRPTSSWQPGEILTDVHRLPLGSEVAPGEYRLLVGLYTPQDGIRLPVTEGAATGGDSVSVASVRVR